MAQKSSNKGSLPHGWLVKASKSHPDRVYYFNTLTGVSTWECPVLVPPEIVKKEPTQNHISILNRMALTPDQTNSEKSMSQDVSTKESIKTLLNKLEVIKYNKQEEASDRLFPSETPSTSTDLKNLNPPTAVVAPVVLERKRSISPPSLRELNKKKFVYKKQLDKKKVQQISLKASLTPSIETFNLKTQRSPENQPVGNCCKEQDKSSFSPTSSADESCFESDHQEEDMATSSQSSAFVPFHPVPSTSKDVSNENFDSVEDVEMQDLSSELSYEDILSENQELETHVPDMPHSYYIVVDTNILIHELRQVDEIKDTPVNGCGPPHIFIPYIVFHELDSLKSSKNYASRLATEAVRYLHSLFKAKHPRFHGQTAKEAHECAKTYSKCNDDRILECCLKLAEEIPQDKVILLTNDKNLANKAFICDIVVHDWPSLKTLLKPDIQIKDGTKRKKDVNKIDSLNPGALSLSSQKNLEKKLVKERNNHETDIDTLMCRANQLLKKVLDTFLEEEMDAAYEDAWFNFKINRNLLKEILGAYLRYWKTVFTLSFNDKDKKNFELLHSKAKRPEGFYGDSEDCLSTLKAIQHVFNRIQVLRPAQDIPLEEIEKLIKWCNEKFSKYNDIDSTISVVESAIQKSELNCVLDAFNHNWRVINELCGMIMDCYGVSHNFAYTKPSTFPPQSEFRRVMPNLYPALLQLKQIMKGMLDDVKSSSPNQSIFKKLYKALNDLVPSLYIQVEVPSLPNFTPKTLEMYCRDPANRQTLECGLDQLNSFCSKLNECLLQMVQKKDNNSSTTASVLPKH